MKTITGHKANVVRSLMITNLWWNASLMYSSPFSGLKALQRVTGKYKSVTRYKEVQKLYVNNGHYLWDMYYPRWPSRAFDRYFNTVIREQEPSRIELPAIRRLFVAITKKCPLRCKHCCEWDTLNSPDIMSYDEIIERTDKMVQDGVAQIFYTGGEPLNRYDDLVRLVKHHSKLCDQWLFTSGYNLTVDKAHELASSGLNGVSISLDHHDENEHNAFRGNDKSYSWALKAIENCKIAGLTVAISICPSRNYLHEDGLKTFIELASDLEVPFVNILEPRSVGHYENKDVEWSIQDSLETEQYVNEINSKHLNKPTLILPSMSRKFGICGGGRIYAFLDADGVLYPCPYCKTPIKKNNQTENYCSAPMYAS